MIEQPNIGQFFSSNHNTFSGLSVPEEEEDEGPIEFRIGGQKFRNPFKTGNFFVFDDSFETELKNGAKKNLIVLVADIWHPELEKEAAKQLAPLEVRIPALLI